MARVVIDGIEYLTRAEMPELTVKRLKAALTALVSIQYKRLHARPGRCSMRGTGADEVGMARPPRDS